MVEQARKLLLWPMFLSPFVSGQIFSATATSVPESNPLANRQAVIRTGSDATSMIYPSVYLHLYVCVAYLSSFLPLVRKGEQCWWMKNIHHLLFFSSLFLL